MSTAAKPKALLTVDELMTQAFSHPRLPRSAEYRMGVRAALELWIEHKAMPTPFAVGTVEADAFFAGEVEGRNLWTLANIRAGDA